MFKKIIFNSGLALMLVFALAMSVQAAKYDVPIEYSNTTINGNSDIKPATTDALLQSFCYQAADEPFGGVACRPENKFLQQLGAVVTCAKPDDLKLLAEAQQANNKKSFNCFTNQASSACRDGWCAQPGGSQCIVANNTSCPANLNRVNICPGACGSCNADAVYCPVPNGQPQNPGVFQGPNYGAAVSCQLKQYGPGGGVVDPSDPQSCKSQGRDVANYCDGSCTACAAGFTESGRNRGACIPFAQRFVEVFKDGLTSLGGPNLDGRYDYSDTGSVTFLTDVFLKADIAETINWNNANLPAVVQSLFGNRYDFCAQDSDCPNAGQLCSADGLCYEPLKKAGDICANSSTCNLGLFCDELNKCASPVQCPGGLSLGGQCHTLLSVIKDQLDNNLYKLWDGVSKWRAVYVADADCNDGEVLAWDNTAKQWQCSVAASGGGLWNKSGNNIYYSSGNVAIGLANSATAETLHISQQDNDVAMRVESAGDKDQLIRFGGNTRQGFAPFAYAAIPYGFSLGRVGDADFNKDLLVIDREEPVGTFTKRLFSLNKDGILTLFNYTSCGSLNTDSTGKVNCGSLPPSSPWKSGIKYLGGPSTTFLDTGANEVMINANINDVRPTARLGVGTSSPETALHIINNGTNVLQKSVALSATNYGYMMLGQPTADNMVFDTNTIQARSNVNVGADLELNRYGGNITLAQSSSGRVGIGTGVPNYTLDVNGTAGKSSGTTWVNTSDIRLKDIQGNYDMGLAEILKLQPVEFNYKKNNPLNLPTDDQVGFIAQEVQKVFPNAVTKREDGYLDFNMHSINVALVNAIKDQQKIIESLEKRIIALEKTKK